MLKCPKCDNAEPARFMGHQVSEIYDGVLVWRCLECGHAWPRKFGIGRRDQAATEYATSLNDG